MYINQNIIVLAIQDEMFKIEYLTAKGVNLSKHVRRTYDINIPMYYNCPSLWIKIWSQLFGIFTKHELMLQFFSGGAWIRLDDKLRQYQWTGESEFKIETFQIFSFNNDFCPKFVDILYYNWCAISKEKRVNNGKTTQ